MSKRGPEEIINVSGLGGAHSELGDFFVRGGSVLRLRRRGRKVYAYEEFE